MVPMRDFLQIFSRFGPISATLAVISQQTPAFLNKREKLLKNANRQSECGSFILDNLTDLETRAALGGSRSGGFINVPILEKK